VIIEIGESELIGRYSKFSTKNWIFLEIDDFSIFGTEY